MAKPLIRLLNVISIFLSFVALISVMQLLTIYPLPHDIGSFLWIFCLPLAVLLITISVFLVSEGAREQQNAPMSLPETTAEVAPVKTNLLPAGTSLELELKQYEEYLAKLVELKLSGQISDNAYQALKEDYKAKIEELMRKKLQTKVS